MKFNKWTLGLAAVGLVSLASVVQAEEKPSSVMTSLSSTMLSGYVDTSAQWNMGTGNANNPKYAFGGAGKADGFNLNVVKLSLAKDPDATDKWGAGYKFDALFGPDANSFNTLSSTGGAGPKDFAIKQAYVDLKADIGNGLDLKMGVWDTIIGYEVFESGNNPNFTRSYAYTIEPTTHTGLLASYQVNEMIGLSAGIADTFGPTINGRANPPRAESSKTFLGSVSLTAPKDWGFIAGSTLYGCVIDGFNGGPGNVNQTSFYVGTSVNTPLKELKLGASYDYAGTPKSVGITSTYANAIDLYATYQVTEKLSLNGRGEYFSQSRNTGFGAPATTASPASGGVAFGLPAEVLALTATAQYDLWKNVISRMEFRWDHQASGENTGFAPVNAYGTGSGKRNAYEVIANIIYKF